MVINRCFARILGVFVLFLTVNFQLSAGFGRDIWIGSGENFKDRQSSCRMCNGSLLQWDQNIPENSLKMASRIFPNQSFLIGNYNKNDNSFSFEGCTDKNFTGNRNNSYKFPNGVSPILCKKICHGHMYFVIKEGKECVCSDGENIRCQHEPCPSGQYPVYSNGLLFRCTFEGDCSCNITYDDLWEKSDICHGTDELNSENSINTAHKTCMVIKNKKALAAINFTVTSSDIDTKCLTLKYYMNGIVIKSLSIYLVKDSNNNFQRLDPVWRANGNHGNVWKEAQVNIRNSKSFKVVIVGEVTSSIFQSFESYLAIDNLTVASGECNNRNLEGFDCSFERNTCGWWQVYNKTRKWTRNGGPTLTKNTGPDRDRRSQNGYYLYAEADVGSKTDEAVLYSPIVVAAKQNDYCFSFWYFIYGKGVNSLKVFIYSNITTDSSIWNKKKEDSTDKWKHAFVDIKNSSHFLIAFKTTKEKEDGDIAIDDISLSDGRCDGLTIFDYDFENDSDLFDWKISSTSTSKWQINKNDSIRYITARFPKDSKKCESTKLISKVVSSKTSSKFCLQFDHSLNSTIGLKIHITRILGGNTKVTRTLFDHLGFKDESTRKRNISIFSTEDFQIAFEAYVHTNTYEMSMVNIDNIKLSIGDCFTNKEPSEVCPAIHFSGTTAHALMEFCTNKVNTNQPECKKIYNRNPNPPMCEKKNPLSVIKFYNLSTDCNLQLINISETVTTLTSTTIPSVSTMENTTINDTLRTNTVQEAEKFKQFELQILVGILGALCAVLVVVFVLFIFINRRRTRNETKTTTEGLPMEYAYADKILPQTNRTYNYSGQQTSKTNDTQLVYDVASLNKPFVDDKEIDGGQDLCIYKDLKENEYDAIGKIRERHAHNKELQNNIYDHTINKGKKDGSDDNNEYDAVLLNERHKTGRVDDEYSLIQNL